MKSTTQTLDWIKDFPHELFKDDEIPLFGISEPFPIEKFAENLSRAFNIPAIEISISEPSWRQSEDLFTNLGNPYEVQAISLPPLEGTLLWTMSKQDYSLLIAQLLSTEPSTLPEEILTIQDKELEKAFYQFILLEAIKSFNQLKLPSTFSPELSTIPERSKETSICFDITFRLKEAIIHGRLIIPNDLRKSWKEYASRKKLDLFATSGIAKKLPVTLHARVGSVQLTVEEWENIQLGDFLVLDSCSISPDTLQGEAVLTLFQSPIFRGNFEQEKLQITEELK